MSYDMIDRFLRNNLGDDDYAEYSAALDALVAPPKQDVPETNFGNMAEPKIGCVNHDCDQCKAVQEPVFCEYCGGNDDADFGLPTDHCTDCARPQPAAQKPWVGLTDDEIRQCETTNSRSYIVHARAIEAKLKEKNHG
jgi:hypothetical protein